MGDCLDDKGNEDDLFEEPDSVADDDAEYYDEDNNFLFNTWNNEINSKIHSLYRRYQFKARTICQILLLEAFHFTLPSRASRKVNLC